MGGEKKGARCSTRGVGCETKKKKRNDKRTKEEGGQNHILDVKGKKWEKSGTRETGPTSSNRKVQTPKSTDTGRRGREKGQKARSHH